MRNSFCALACWDWSAWRLYILMAGAIVMRDIRKNPSYFLALIERNQSEIKLFHDWIMNGEVATERICHIKRTIYQHKRNIWYAKYSLGEQVFNLLDSYEEMTNDFLENFVPEWYEDGLLLLSLGILLNSDFKLFEALAVKVQEDGKNDWLYNYLINSRISNVEYKNCKILWPSIYLPLRKIVEESQNKPADMCKYLSKTWYKSHKDSPWYNTHLREKDDKFDYDKSTYRGYWSFESGAVAKLLGFDDLALKDTHYYPYDLVHW